MKYFLFSFVLFFHCNLLFSQDFGIWRKGDTVGFTPRYAQSASVLSGKIYVIGGRLENDLPSTVLEVYNPSANSWTTPKMTGTFKATAYFASAVVADKIYIIGGTNQTDLGNVSVFDPINNSWSPMAPMPTARNGLVASTVGNKIYAIGGANVNGFLSTVEVFDPLAGPTGVWSKPGTAGWFHPMANMTASVVNDKIYIIGGFDGGLSIIDSVYIFDPASNSWSSPTTTGTFTPRDQLTSSVLNNKIYVFGGQSQGMPLNTVEVFNPTLNSWDTVRTRDSLTPRYALTSSVVGSSIYVMGGTPDSQQPYNLNEIFTPSTSGVESKKTNDDISISPNPSDRFISVHGENITHITIIDMLGRAVVKNNYPSASHITLDLSGLKEGIYYAECMGKYFITVKKIVKIH